MVKGEGVRYGYLREKVGKVSMLGDEQLTCKHEDRPNAQMEQRRCSKTMTSRDELNMRDEVSLPSEKRRY